MKSNRPKSEPVVEPLLKGLIDRAAATAKSSKQDPSVESTPSQSPDLYQDPGGAYNPGFTFPQQ